MKVRSRTDVYEGIAREPMFELLDIFAVQIVWDRLIAGLEIDSNYDTLEAL